MKKMGHIFISYKSGEAAFALRIAADLRNSGIKVWMDRLDIGIRPSQDWRLSIANALTVDICSGMIAILSPNYIESKYCQNELARADRLGIQIYPIVLTPLEDTKWPLEVERLQYVDFQEWQNESIYNKKFTDLLDVIKDKFPRQVINLPDPETQYLTSLIAEIETRHGIVNYVELEGETTKATSRPSPTIEQETGYMVLLNQDDPKKKKQKRINIKKISEATELYRQFVLIGDPGAGKTTVLRNMVIDLARKHLENPRTVPIPMIAYLPQWQDNLSFEEFLKAKWALNSNPIEMLEKGDLFLYLDGLNEMGAEKISKVNELRSWTSKSPSSAQLIITCRADDYNEDLRMGNLPTVGIKPLTESQIKLFAKRYLGKESKRFLQQILQNESEQNGSGRELMQLAVNPYFLTAFIIIYNSSPQVELPRNSGTLFKKLVLALWKREEQRGSTNIPFETAEAEFARLAFAMIDSDMPVDVSLDYAFLMLSDKEYIKIGEKTNYLSVQSNSIRFYHQLIQEYFAAIGLAKAGISHIRLDKKPLQTSSGYSKNYRYFREEIYEFSSIPEYRRSSKWDQVIISLCGFTEYPEVIIKKLARIDPLLAVDCLLSGLDISHANVIDEFIAATIDENSALRKAALVSLAKIGNNKVISHLAKALDDSDSEVSILAASLLLQFGKDAIPHLINHLKSASEDRAKLSIQAIATLDIQAIPVLNNLLASNSSVDIKVRACTVLGKIKHKDSASILLPLLKSKDERLVKEAIEGLGNIGDQSSVPALVSILSKTPKFNINVLISVVEALGNIRNAQAVPALIRLINNKSWELHSAALASLRRISTREAHIPIKLYEQLKSRNGKTQSDVVQKILDNYGTIGLIHALRHANRSFWSIAHKFVGLPETEYKILLRAMDDHDSNIKAAIAYNIGERNDNKREKMLTPLLKDRRNFVKGIAVKATGKLKYKRVIPELIILLSDEHEIYSNSKERVCDAAAKALLNFKLKKVESALKEWAVKQTEGRISEDQDAAIIVLGRIGDNEVVPRLAKFMKYKSYRIRNSTRKALRNIGTPEALKVIEEHQATTPTIEA